MNKNIFKINSIVFEDKEYIFTKSLKCEIKKDHNDFIVMCKKLDIFAYGENKHDAIEAFNFSVFSLCENYIKEDEVNLTRDVIKLKNKLRKLIKINNLCA